MTGQFKEGYQQLRAIPMSKQASQFLGKPLIQW
jgi:hypothetical protein